jgi:hypothetical protein
MRRFFRRKATAVTIGALALTLLGGGLAAAASPSDQNRPAAQVAAAPDDSGSSGQPPVSEADKARAQVVPGTTAGLPPTAQVHFAVVNSNGTLARGFQVISSTRLGLGWYQVVFNHDLRGSAFIATLGLTGSVYTSPSGEIAVVGRTGLSNGVFVQTWNSAGARADRSFHLAVLS